MELCDMKLKMSSSRHPQTDGSSEIINRTVDNILRLYSRYNPYDFDKPLPGSEFAYNCAVSEDFELKLFEIDLVWTPNSSLVMIYGTIVPNEALCHFKNQVKETLDDPKYAYNLAKVEQREILSTKYRPHSFKPRASCGSTSLCSRTLIPSLRGLIT